MRKIHVSQPAVLLAFAAITASMVLSLRTDAQQAAETLRLHAGDTLEMGTDTPIPRPQFVWTLVRDRKFQNAQRSRFFQMRFAQAGTYVLDASVQNEGGAGNELRSFTLIVDESVAQPTFPSSASDTTPLLAAVRTEPPIYEGKVYLPAGGGLLKIDPSVSQGKITAYELDLDSTVDTDGDGNPTNDRDTMDTLSQKNGTPITLYALPKNGVRTVTLSVTNLSASAPSALTFEIVFGGTIPAGALSSASSASNPATQVGGSPITAKQDGLTVTFSSAIDPAQIAGKELLYAWDFGDRGKSLLNTPTHTYASPGSYAVTLTVTDISTGQVLFTGNGSVSVQAPVTPVSSSSSSTTVITSSASSVSSAPSSGGPRLPIGSILKVGLIIILLIALCIGLYAVIHWIKSKATGKLQDTFEKMEKNIVKKENKPDAVEGTIEPMKLKKETAKAEESATVREKELAKTEFTSQTRTNETPSSSAGPVPSWLAKPAGNAPAATPAPAPKTAPAAPASEQKVPDWLKPQAAPAKQESAPQAPVTPNAKPAQSSATAPVPDWLKPKPAAASSTPAPTAVPPSGIPQSQGAPGPVPDWLKPKTPAAATPAPAPAPIVAPKPAEAPKPQEQKAPVTPAPAAAPAPAVAAKPAESPKPQPPAPKPAAPKAEAPKPAAAPAATPPAPAMPKQEAQPKPKVDTPKPQQQSKQEQKPQPPQPKNEAPKQPQAQTPKPAQAQAAPIPAPVTPAKVSAPPAPAVKTEPTPVPLSTTPAPVAKPAPSKSTIEAQVTPAETKPEATPNDDDKTIAIIQADSLTK